MKFFTLAIIIYIILSLVQVNAKGYICSKHFVVKHGDRCRYFYNTRDNESHIKYKELVHINPNIDCENLSSGTKICVEINFDDKYDSHNFNFESYKIKKGDTWEKVAKYLKSDMNELVNANFGTYPNILDIKKLVGKYIDYRKDGDYKPIFKDSKEFDFKYIAPK
ncbi:hypothetical protein BCR32DRAFT_292936 [Anaeromyces robustus]|uniref:LysM domain-containing protein n=1 Tax=Anaeromyces robustus TaxID=1754192 RepID=A0A1Y1X874_9FUNG|nr:hypothetical protein BCR32DRAFT_292936 [Anaeromyces robustus]|eukprot:ORX81961.1 hypothetical protein BCR32DRAFT_292936 [Anaeromyces robustus]